MLLTLSDVLDREELDETLKLIGGLGWRDGAETAGGTARAVKHNQQADLTSRLGTQVQHKLKSKLESHLVLRAAAIPRQYSKLIVSRTREGGCYGHHVDNPFMPVGTSRLRTDFSFTLFLSEPETYEGGELSMTMAAGDIDAKPAAGTLILYPSGAIHQVKPVVSGTRLACVG